MGDSGNGADASVVSGAVSRFGNLFDMWLLNASYSDVLTFQRAVSTGGAGAGAGGPSGSVGDGAGGNWWEVSLKGAGRTPYSRAGDGRAVLVAAFRELLGSAALNALGVPTTRCLCVVAGDATVDGVYRDGQ